ncbi:Fanconi anemia group F protein [Amia ocellicauda]|uniref:Fanconi anemia group F protein n=1 Tax=Amia ocellicauda TaxID=2972642 RepID=UPI00346407EA
MEAILQNLEATVQLLAVARSPFVSEWDVRTMERALQWTLYCQGLHGRFRDRPAIRTALEERLQATNLELRAAFRGHRGLGFEELGTCRAALLVSLLQNPAVSARVADRVMSECLGGSGSGDGTFNHLARTAATRAAGQVLSSAAKLSAEAPILPAVAQTQGRMLLRRLDTVLAGTDPQRLGAELLDTALRGCSGEEQQPGEAPLLAAALLQEAGGSRHARDFALQWLLGSPCLLQRVCRALPAAAPRELAQNCLGFRTAYLETLTDWGRGLEYDVTAGEWVPREGGSEVRWAALLEHFGGLLQGPPACKEAAEAALRALKSADGDFEVWGLSVWTDLLTALKGSPLTLGGLRHRDPPSAAASSSQESAGLPLPARSRQCGHEEAGCIEGLGTELHKFAENTIQMQ